MGEDVLGQEDAIMEHSALLRQVTMVLTLTGRCTIAKEAVVDLPRLTKDVLALGAAIIYNQETAQYVVERTSAAPSGSGEPKEKE